METQLPASMTLQQFLDALKAQGVPRHHLAFRCPMCKTVQSAEDLIKAGAGDSIASVEGDVGFSCVGRWTGAGPHQQGDPPGRGCDWTLGGLLHLHELEVVTDDGERHPRFVPVTADEAQQHMQETG